MIKKYNFQKVESYIHKKMFSACFFAHLFYPLCRQLDADIMLLSLYLKEFTKLYCCQTQPLIYMYIL